MVIFCNTSQWQRAIARLHGVAVSHAAPGASTEWTVRPFRVKGLVAISCIHIIVALDYPGGAQDMQGVKAEARPGQRGKFVGPHKMWTPSLVDKLRRFMLSLEFQAGVQTAVGTLPGCRHQLAAKAVRQLTISHPRRKKGG